MRTLVVSDLHLGSRTRTELLLRPEAQAQLLDAVSQCDRLVLLGDLLELRQGPQWEAFDVARPVLAQIGATLPPDSEIVMVPGNHDHRLLRGWFDRRGPRATPLGLATEVDWHADELLGVLIACLGARLVRVSYPGVWLREDVYAIHGHYGDRHTVVPILERLGAGVNSLLLGEEAAQPARAEDYEATLAPMYAWIDTIAQAQPAERGRARGGMQARTWRRLSGSDRSRLRRAAVGAAFSAVIAALNRGGVGPLRPQLSDAHLRRGALRGFGEVLARLQVDARHVISGHTHRAGPLPGDQQPEWLSPTGARMVNTGSWVHEPDLIGEHPWSSPYRPGFCAWLEDGAPPELRCLLDSSPGVMNSL